MYRDHPVLYQPTEPEETLWRYMDLSTFLAVLEYRCLYFPRVDTLDDPFEGSFPRQTVDRRRSSVEGMDPDRQDAVLTDLSEAFRSLRMFTFVNCWHMSQHESAAMWSLYSKDHQGIAIRSTVQRLRDSFAVTDSDVYLSHLRYMDFDNDLAADATTFDPFLIKRKSFAHENEVRAIVQRLKEIPADGGAKEVAEKKSGLESLWVAKDGDWVKIDLTKPPEVEGLSVPVDLELLVDSVFVTPDAAPWFVELVSRVTGRLGLGAEVQQSELLGEPLY